MNRIVMGKQIRITAAELERLKVEREEPKPRLDP